MTWAPIKWAREFKAAMKKRAEKAEKEWNERQWLVRTEAARRRRKYAFRRKGQMAWWL